MTAWRFRTGIEAELETFKDVTTQRLTLGVSTYFATRWVVSRRWWKSEGGVISG
jgi:hypothetical protein